jgi:hypothetical protein
MLGAAVKTTPRLAGFDFARLEQRAVDQFERVETRAREVAQEIFSAELNESAAK